MMSAVNERARRASRVATRQAFEWAGGGGRDDLKRSTEVRNLNEQAEVGVMFVQNNKRSVARD